MKSWQKFILLIIASAVAPNIELVKMVKKTKKPSEKEILMKILEHNSRFVQVK